MASQILPVVCNSLPKLLIRSQVGRLSVCSSAWHRQLQQQPLPSPSLTCLLSSQYRHIHTAQQQQMGLVDGLKRGLGMKQYKYNRYTLDNSSIRLYVCICEQIDFDLFFKELDLEDTFNSWFRIMELHMWLVLTRLAEEGDDGKRVANNIILSLWNDMDKRTRKLGDGVSATRRKAGTEALFSEFRFSLCSYDEGMLSNDMVLAGALWRTFFQKQVVSAKQLETMVCYVRKQQLYLHDQDPSILLTVGLCSFLPLYGDELDEEKNKALFNSIICRT